MRISQLLRALCFSLKNRFSSIPTIYLLFSTNALRILRRKLCSVQRGMEVATLFHGRFIACTASHARRLVALALQQRPGHRILALDLCDGPVKGTPVDPRHDPRPDSHHAAPQDLAPESHMPPAASSDASERGGDVGGGKPAGDEPGGDLLGALLGGGDEVAEPWQPNAAFFTPAGWEVVAPGSPAPTLEHLLRLLYGASAWLRASPNNLAVVACPDGRSRCSLIAAAFLK